MKHFLLSLLALTVLLSQPPAWARKIQAQKPSQQAVEQKELGNRHFQRGDFLEAITCYTEALNASPAYFEAHYNRGLSWHSLKLFYKAIVDFDRALELRPNDPDVLYYRGLAYEATGQFGEALADMQSASSKGCEQAEKYLKTGSLKQRAGLMAQKEKTLRALTNSDAEKIARSTRTTLRCNVFGGPTTTTVFSKGDPLYDGPDGMFKQINHYNKSGTLRRSETFHHALFSARNNRSRTTSHFNGNGTITLVEHHLSGHDLGKVKLFHYGEGGALTGTETIPLARYQEMGLDKG